MYSVSRGVVERATRSWTFQRHLPAAFGSARIVVSPSAGLKYLFKSMERIDAPLLRSAKELVRPGNIVWDVGANIGLFAFAAAARAGSSGQVVAFEPDPWLVRLLRRSCALQSPQSSPTMIIPAAVASEVALRKLLIARRSRASNSLAGYGHSQSGGVLEELIIPTFNLDWLLSTLPPPNVLKCDVEGAEVEVFARQVTMLRDVRPVVICEVGSTNSREITSIMQEHNYRMFDGEGVLLESQEVNVACWNTIAIPKERLADYLKA